MPAPVSVAILRLRGRLAARRDTRLLRAQLPLVVSVLGAYVRAGRSLRQAVADAAGDAPDPSGRALRVAATAIALGAPPGEALGALGDDPDVAHLVALVEMQIRTGGDLALLLDRMADVLRAREELRRAAAVATAQAACDGAYGVGHAGVRACGAVAARPAGLRSRGGQSAGVGRAPRVGAAGGARPRPDHPDRDDRAVSGWALLLAAALFGAEAVRAHRREPRAARRWTVGQRSRRWRRSARRPASRLPAKLVRPPNRDLVRRAGVQILAGDVVAARVASALCFGGLGLGGAVVVGGAIGIVVGTLLLAFGCVYPDLWLQ